MQQPQMQLPPTPPVDPDNAEFVIFVRSKMLPQWIPLSIMKGGGPANLLVKANNDLARKQLLKNIGQAVYKERASMENAIRKQFPPFKATKQFEFGYKIRDKANPKDWDKANPKDWDKANPKDWYLVKGVELLPEEAELGGSAFEDVKENVSSFFTKTFSNLTGGAGAGSKAAK
ncbi:hypothetical protein N2152v2_003250 [Parachlorella kessleri]